MPENVWRSCLLFLIIPVSIPLGAWGQAHETGVEELPAVLSQGDRVQVTLVERTNLEGQVVDVTSQTVIIRTRGNETRNLSSASISEIRRRSPDRWWNGLLIGAGAGAAFGIVADLVEGDPCEQPESLVCFDFSPLYLPVFGLVGTAIGGVTDLFIGRYDTVYQNPDATRLDRLIIAPVVSAEVVGLRLGLSF